MYIIHIIWLVLLVTIDDAFDPQVAIYAVDTIITTVAG